MQQRWLAFTGAGLVIALAASLPATAETRIEKSLKLDPGGKFTLDTVVGAVTVTPEPGAGAHVLITAGNDDFEEKVTLAFEELPGNEVRVTAKKKGSTSWFGSSFRQVKFEIQVPSKTELVVSTSGGPISVSGMEGRAGLDTSGGSITVENHRGEVAADTSGGAIRVKKIEGPATLDTSGGGIEVEDVSGAVKADTSGGPIRMARVDGDIDAETSGGGITIDEAGGRVTASTSGGGIEVSFGPGNSKGGSLETSGGGIRVKLDPGARLRIDASSSGGSVTCDLPVTVQGEVRNSRLRGTIGGGGESLEISTSGGGIRISPR